MTHRLSLSRLIAALGCAALVLMGALHVGQRGAISVSDAAFAQAVVLGAEICGTGSAPESGALSHCPFCHLAGAVTLPETGIPLTVRRTVPLILSAAPAPRSQPRVWLRPPGRGPPSQIHQMT